MTHIGIISASVRTGRKSHRVALYLQSFLEERELATTEIIDLKVYNFPVFEERLRFLANPAPDILKFADKIVHSDGLIIVTPEYNGGYPSSLKNVIDLLYNEWKHKPIAISTVSAGDFGGSQVITSLQFVLWKIGAMTVPAMFPVPKVEQAFDADGEPSDKEKTDTRAAAFINELLWYLKAAGTGKLMSTQKH